MANQVVLERIIVCRIALLMKLPFWGNLVTRLLLKEELEDWCKTAATNGREIMYNPDFMMKLSDPEIIFVMGHEVLHVILDHLGRSAHDNRGIANLAADFAANAILVQEKVGTPIGGTSQFITRQDLIDFDPTKEKKRGVLHDPYYKDMCYEEIYDDLLKIQPKIQKAAVAGLGGMDQHLDGHDGTPEIPSEEISKIRDVMREAILSAAQSVGIGNVPAGIKRLIGNLIAPVMSWQQIITQQIESQVKNDYTYMRLGRRSFSSDFIFPSFQREPRIRLTLALDMSGSISEQEIIEYFSEILGILDQYASFELGILCFDSGVHNYQVFTEDTRDELLAYEPKGGGGTVFSCVYDFLKENDIMPTQLGFFTDGECFGDWGDPDYCETFFLIKNSREIIAPFGLTIKYVR